MSTVTDFKDENTGNDDYANAKEDIAFEDDHYHNVGKAKAEAGVLRAL